MSKIVPNDKGFKIIEMSTMEFLFIGGQSICDVCNEKMLKGYYISVLNRAYCQKHFNEWLNTAIRYEEDIPYELSKFEAMRLVLKAKK
ncbi:hypothetical protein EV196_11342 [Mariniflexile fucanivorans]|uniref:Uncharacterized protein n=1 Tax=Mariniflexile fucanivorans TaxID=264023 RepID=A0A4R1RA78_9FLAO|nr:demethylase [Mariniflexile fucanivorans]TCL62500.1 hypothetical protein EV196_11342 [Mariniflexile fucanivorans]